MDFYNKLINIKKWDQFIEFLEIMGLQILDFKTSIINSFRKFLGFSYKSQIIIGNSIVKYLLYVEILEVDNKNIYINIKSIQII